MLPDATEPPSAIARPDVELSDPLAGAVFFGGRPTEALAHADVLPLCATAAGEHTDEVPEEFRSDKDR